MENKQSIWYSAQTYYSGILSVIVEHVTGDQCLFAACMLTALILIHGSVAETDYTPNPIHD